MKMGEREENEDDQFYFSHAPRMPEDDLIRSEVAVLTGGRDQHGRPIIALPAKYHGILESKVKASGMESLLRYFVDITRAADRKRGFAIVTDLRFSVLDFILLLKSILNSIQAEMKGAVGTCVLYVVLPLNKKTRKDTLTHLALRQSKKKINKNIVPPYFTSVAVDDEMELYNYIEKSHLTPDLGGYLQYSHQHWVEFRRIVEPFFANFESVQARLPDAYQQLTAMANVNGGNKKEQLQQTHGQLQDAYHDLRRGLYLDQALQQCEKLLQRFQSIDEEDVFSVLAQKPIFKETKEMVEGCYEILVAARKKIEEDWKAMSRRITQAVQLIDYRADVTKLLDWFKSKRERALQQGADVAESLSRAEMLCTHLETGLVVKAKEKLARARELMEQGEAMVIDEDSRSVTDVMMLVNTLKQDAQDFQDALQSQQELLQSVYHFHQLYTKARRWYVKCIQFLPSDLHDLYSDIRSTNDNHRALRLQWEEDVRRFLHKYPLLAKEELKKLKMIPEDIGDTALKRKGKLLSYRCLVLTSLLSHKEKTSLANIRDILKWQSEIPSPSDDSASNQSNWMRKAPSEGSLDTSHHNHQHKKAESTTKSNPKKKNVKKMAKDDTYRSSESPDRGWRQNRHRDRFSDRQNHTTLDTDSDDPLLRRLQQAGAIYDRHGDTQGQVNGEGYDEVDNSQDKWVATQRHRSNDRTQNEVLVNAQQLSLFQHQRMPAHSQHIPRDRSPSRPLTSNHAQTYGVYGDSDFEDDSAVIIHNQGQSYPPQGLPEDMLPGNQLHHQGHTQTPARTKSRSGKQQHIVPSEDPSNIVLGNQQPTYGLLQQGPNQAKVNYNTVEQPASVVPSSKLFTHSVHPQNGTTLSSTPPHGHQTGAPSNFNSDTKSYSPNSHAQLRQRSHVNDMTSSTRAPISFHGSLMNIHQSHMDSDVLAVSGLGSQGGAAMNSSPVTRHRSLTDLSQLPITDEAGRGNLQHSPVQTSLMRSDQHSIHPQQNSVISSAPTEMSPIHQNVQNYPYDFELSNLNHGVAEPEVTTSSSGHLPSTYSDVLATLSDVRLRASPRPVQSTSRSSKHRHSKNSSLSPSHHALSRSATDLRYPPQRLNPLIPNGLAQSKAALHRSDMDLRQTQFTGAHVPDVLPSQNVFPSGHPTDPQVEYYKKLYPTSLPHLNQSTAISGQRNTDHILDPSVHTWMHEIPSPDARHKAHLSDKLPSTSRPLSPLALLEIEVAKETLDAEEAIREDEYSAEQLRRQAVIDSVLGQSESRHRTRDLSAVQNDQRVSSEDQMAPRNSHRGQRGQRSGKGQRQRESDLLSSSRKAGSLMPRKSSPHRSILKNVSDPRSLSEATIISKSQSSDRSSQLLPVHKDETLSFHQGSVPLDNDWREQHLRDLGLTPPSTQSGTATSPDRQSVNMSRLLHQADRQLGLSTTLPQSHTQKQSGSTEHVVGNELNQSQDFRSQPQVTPPRGFSGHISQSLQRHSPYDAGVTTDKLTTASPRQEQVSYDSELVDDWRQMHLRELGLSPTVQQPVGKVSMKGGMVSPKHIGSSVSDTDWRRKHLLDLGISPSMPQINLNKDLPQRGSLSEVNDNDWRRQHLLELGISPSMNHSVANQETGSVRRISGDRSLETDADWRRNHLNDLGISPGSYQYHAPSAPAPAGSARTIAPVTNRLRGVIGNGRSLNEMEELHGLADETTKKSVRFAHLSDESILDVEEQAQEEVARQLHQLELRLQEEENLLKHRDVLDDEEAVLNHQLRALDQQEEHLQRKHVGDGYTGHQTPAEGAVQPQQAQIGQHSQLTANPGHQVLFPRANQPARYQSSQGSEVSANLNHQMLHEGTVQPTHIQSSPYSEAGTSPGHQEVLKGAVHTKFANRKLLSEGAETRVGANFLKRDIMRSKTVTQNGYPSPIRTQEGSLTKAETDIRERGKLSGISKLPQNDTVSVNETRADAEKSSLNDKFANDRAYISAKIQSHRERTGLQDGTGSLTEVQRETNSINGERELRSFSKPEDGDSSAVGVDYKNDRNIRRGENLQHADHSPGEFNWSKKRPHGSISDQAKLDSSSQQKIENPISIGPNGHQDAVESRDLSNEKFDKFPETDHFKEIPVTDPTRSHIPDKSVSQKGEDSQTVRNVSNEVFASDELPGQALQSERDHTAADYIACALGMEYVNDVTHLTVQPFSNSSKSTLEQSSTYNKETESKDHSQPQQSFAQEKMMGQAHPNYTQKSEMIPTGAGGQKLCTDKASTAGGLGVRSNRLEDGMPVKGLVSVKVPLVRLPVSSGSMDEGPCSPLRQWLKEKELLETTDPIGTNQSKSSGVTETMDQQAVGSDLAISRDQSSGNMIHSAESPTVHSQNSSQIREWLREKQLEEARESAELYQDLAEVNSGMGTSVINDSLERTLNMATFTSPVDAHGSRYVENQEKLQKGRTKSSIPLPVGSRRMSDVENRHGNPSRLGARRRSGSAIPIYKGLSNSSKLPPTLSSGATTRHASPSEDDQTMQEEMKKHHISSKKGNKYSKIPVPKIYSALKDGGYLEKTQSPKDESSLQQVSAAKRLVTSTEPAIESKESKPALERQGTFTKETRPTLTREGTFTIESKDGEIDGPVQDAATISRTAERNRPQPPLPPLALVLDHVVKKGSVSPSVKQETQITGGDKKRHDSVEETFENSSTESSMSPTTKTTIIASKKPTTNLYNTKNYYINVSRGNDGNHEEVMGSTAIGHNESTYEVLTESDRKEHNSLDENEVEKMIATKSQLAEIRNLEIENRHLAYERKELEAHYIRNMQKHQDKGNTSEEA